MESDLLRALPSELSLSIELRSKPLRDRYPNPAERVRVTPMRRAGFSGARKSRHDAAARDWTAGRRSSLGADRNSGCTVHIDPDAEATRRMYTHVTIVLKYGQLPLFLETMPKVQAIVETIGWVLKEALLQVNGRLFTVIHVWQLRDMNHYAEGLALLAEHPDFPALGEALGTVVESETITFAQPLPYAPASA